MTTKLNPVILQARIARNREVVRWYLMVYPFAHSSLVKGLERELRRRKNEGEPPIEYFAPTFTEAQTKDGQIVVTERPLLYNYFFIKASEREIFRIKQFEPQISFYRREIRSDGVITFPSVSEDAIRQLRWISKSYSKGVPVLSAEPQWLVKGDRVRLTSGRFKGIEATVYESPKDGRKELLVYLDNCNWVPLLHVAPGEYELIEVCESREKNYSVLGSDSLSNTLHSAMLRYLSRLSFKVHADVSDPTVVAASPYFNNLSGPDVLLDKPAVVSVPEPGGLGRDLEMGEAFGTGRAFGIGEDSGIGKAFEIGGDSERGEAFGMGRDSERGKAFGMGKDIERGKAFGIGKDIERGKAFGIGGDLKAGASEGPVAELGSQRADGFSNRGGSSSHSEELGSAVAAGPYGSEGPVVIEVVDGSGVSGVAEVVDGSGVSGVAEGTDVADELEEKDGPEVVDGSEDIEGREETEDREVARKALRSVSELAPASDLMRAKQYAMLLYCYTILGEEQQKSSLLSAIEVLLPKLKAEQSKAVLALSLYACTSDAAYYALAHQLIDPWRTDEKPKKSKQLLLSRLADFDKLLKPFSGNIIS